MRLPAVSKVGRDVGILGSGAYTPDEVVTNAELYKKFPGEGDWIQAKTGIRERRYLAVSESTSDMCIRAGKMALENAGVKASGIDALVLATNSPDYVLPSMGLAVQAELGLDDAFVLDLTQGGCCAALLGLYLGAQFFLNPECRDVLVIGAEAMTRITNADRADAVFFGDAAGALVLHRLLDRDAGFLAWDLGGTPSMALSLNFGARTALTPQYVSEGRHLLQMNGRAVWEKASTHMPQSLTRVSARSGVALDQVGLFVLHQANLRLIEYCMTTLNAPLERAHCTIHKFGNTGAATLPLTFHDAFCAGKLNRDCSVAFASAGAGFFWGAALYQHTTRAESFL